MQRKTLFLSAIVPVVAWGAGAFALDSWGHRVTASSPADCIVVLGAGVIPPGVAGLALRARTERAAELYHAGLAPYILCTGGVGRIPPAESLIATRILVERGIPAAAIAREERSTSTWENGSEAAVICHARGWKRVILVSDSYHLFRATHNFRHFGLEATPSPVPNPPPVRRTLMSLREAILVARDALGGRL